MRTPMISFAALALVGVALPANAQHAPYGFAANAPYADRYDGLRTVAWDGDDKHGNKHHDDKHHDDKHHDNGWHGNKGHDDDRRDDARDWRRGQAYGYSRPDPRYNGYYADNYYRGGTYQTRRLGTTDRIYRGQDNRYYCRRSDGTTGLIIGALGGGVLGNVIAPGGSKTLGSILGGGLGAVLGSSIDKGNVTCR